MAGGIRFAFYGRISTPGYQDVKSVLTPMAAGERRAAHRRGLRVDRLLLEHELAGPEDDDEGGSS